MPKVTFVESDGTTRTTAGVTGDSLLKVAQAVGLESIVGECGGNLSCATCHVYVDPAWLGRLVPVSAEEDMMLDGTYCDREDNSRLGCQIKLSDALDGIVVRVPERQT